MSEQEVCASPQAWRPRGAVRAARVAQVEPEGDRIVRPRRTCAVHDVYTHLTLYIN